MMRKLAKTCLQHLCLKFESKSFSNTEGCLYLPYDGNAQDITLEITPKGTSKRKVSAWKHCSGMWLWHGTFYASASL